MARTPFRRTILAMRRWDFHEEKRSNQTHVLKTDPSSSKGEPPVFAPLSLPKTPSELKMQRIRAFMRSCCYQEELSFPRFFVAGRLQLSNPRCPPSGDPRASSPTHRSPKERAAWFAPPALRPAFVGFALAMVARLAPESTHRSPRYSDRLAP
jgi:hypothetical protein